MTDKVNNPSKLINKAVEDFENKWNSIDNTGTIYGKDNKIYLEENGNQLTAIKSFLTKCMQESYEAGFSKALKIVRENNDIAKSEEECGWTKHCTCLAHSLYCLEKELQSLTKQSKEEKE